MAGRGNLTSSIVRLPRCLRKQPNKGQRKKDKKEKKATKGQADYSKPDETPTRAEQKTRSQTGPKRLPKV